MKLVKIIKDSLLKAEQEANNVSKIVKNCHTLYLGRCSLKEALEIIENSEKKVPLDAEFSYRSECAESLEGVYLQWFTESKASEKVAKTMVSVDYDRKSYNYCVSNLEKAGYKIPRLFFPHTVRVLFNLSVLKQFGAETVAQMIVDEWGLE